MAIGITLTNLDKRFGGAYAVRALDLEAQAGELLVIVGPSGAGKTTLLRLVAGLTIADGGRICFDDRDVTKLAPARRRVGMMFQEAALWPHLSAAANVALSYRAAGRVRGRRRLAAMEALDAVGLGSLASRRPGELSGGERRRVALARALASQPDALLLDEPLGHLDAGLRREMGRLVRRVCKESGVTTMLVTHDGVEALRRADRVAVMRDGRIEQVDQPGRVYERPVSRFVAEQLGEVNAIDGRVKARRGDAVEVETAMGMVRGHAVEQGGGLTPGEGACCLARPESVEIANEHDGDMTYVSVVIGCSGVGGGARCEVEAAGGVRLVISAAAASRAGASTGDQVRITIREDAVTVVPATQGIAPPV